MARYVWLFSVLALVAALAVPQAVALDLQSSGSAAKTTQAREPVAETARKKRKKKRRRPAPPAPAPYATLSGNSDWSNAQVNLQYVSGSSWVNAVGGQSTSDASGNYSNTVRTGYTYRYYVSTWYYMQFNFGFGPILCRQLWADDSPSVTPLAGRSYTGLDTRLRSTGSVGC